MTNIGLCLDGSTMQLTYSIRAVVLGRGWKKGGKNLKEFFYECVGLVLAGYGYQWFQQVLKSIVTCELIIITNDNIKSIINWMCFMNIA